MKVKLIIGLLIVLLLSLILIVFNSYSNNEKFLTDNIEVKSIPLDSIETDTFETDTIPLIDGKYVSKEWLYKKLNENK